MNSWPLRSVSSQRKLLRGHLADVVRVDQGAAANPLENRAREPGLDGAQGLCGHEAPAVTIQTISRSAWKASTSSMLRT